MLWVTLIGNPTWTAVHNAKGGTEPVQGCHGIKGDMLGGLDEVLPGGNTNITHQGSRDQVCTPMHYSGYKGFTDRGCWLSGC